MPEAVVKSKPRFYVAAGLLLAAVAFLRGNYLLGLDVGMAYGVVAVAVVWLLARSFRKTPIPLQILAFTVVVTSIGFVLAFPTAINPDVRHFIAKQETDRNVRSELSRVFRSNNDFADLSITTTHLKVVNVTIKGQLPNRRRWQQLRDRILADCPTLELCPLHWDIRIRGDAVQGLDSELFRQGESAA